MSTHAATAEPSPAVGEGRPALTPAEFAGEMQRLTGFRRDPEAQHAQADELVATMLESLGYGAGVAIFREMERWCA